MPVRLSIGCVLFVMMFAAQAAAAVDVPFRGTFEGFTVSATPVGPDDVLVVTEGTGNLTHLGNYFVTIPHLTHLATLTLEGTQTFTAANGDTLTADFTGQLAPNADGCLAGTLAHQITGGTGRFDGASGSYDFYLVACPIAFGFHSTATFDGVISLPRGH